MTAALPWVRRRLQVGRERNDMCVGVPMKIISIEGDNAIAETDGVQKEASLMLLADEVALGDFVIVHAGFAISRLDPVEAEETLQLMREIFKPEDMA
jgi:hydrogenase expression/formation protein HypC